MTGPAGERRTAALVLAAGLVASAVWLGCFAPAFDRWLPAVVTLQVVGGLLVAWFGTRTTSPLTPRTWAFAVVVAVAVRVPMMASPHILSDDAYRYVWDGRVSAAGVNPFRHAPDDPALDHLRTEADASINHPDLVTVYPPVAQGFFLGAQVLGGGFRGLHLATLLAECAAWVLLGLVLARSRLPWTRFTLVAWFPLVWVQGYTPGHTDLWGLPFLVAFGVAAARRRAALAGATIAAAALVKPIALAFVPAVARAWGVKRTAILSGVALAIGALAYLPFLSAGENLFASAELMARKWSFNGSVAALLEAVVPERALRPILAAVLAAIVAFALFGRRSTAARALLTFAGVVIATTTLYPWYLVWMLPLLAWRPDPSLLVLGSTVAIADLVVGPYQATGVWEPDAWHAWAVYVPFYVTLVVSAARGWGMFGRGPNDVDQPNFAENT